MRGTPIDVRTGTLALTAAVLLTACNGTDQTVAPPPAPSAKPTTPTPTATPTPTRRKLKPGAKGADVEELQRRLKTLHYDPGKVDGRYGPSTQMAVWAFQAVHGMKQKSTLDTSFWKALDQPEQPRPMAKKREKNRVDVDLKRQYLVLYEDGRPRLITHISSGSGEYYCAKDRGAKVPRCRYAVTGTGDFRTGRRFSGWETSPLGRLYNPVYFNGGIAFHGALDVPRYPASHGCVRLPMHIAEYFPDLLGTNVPVHVRRPR
ncbi:putative peptidoglycan binding protein [Actinomadura pelletieri DSM 43383]|uniref:Putative peptidoglycan binding protein n=1 Tax=Actinomadura pelletieri DSM 43383 TaxID=1120940 RepID=A0A495QNQ2_9ACTN|nr:L,D-transpeptidase family protein [Actinomadura pelletieri]RKS74594.1 putative peptidoglycan binding protein [Actinomadura pelletieri DSM 43383]